MTYRSLSLYSPDFNPHGERKIESSAPPPGIRFRHIAFFLLGAILVGCLIGALIGIAVYGVARSNYVGEMVFAISLYATLIVGYHWTSQEREWTGLRARFSPVGKKPLILGASAAVALVLFTWMVASLLEWAGVKVGEYPTPLVLPRDWKQLPLAFFLLVIVAPMCEELIFRGLLLDWLKQKMNVRLAALILSMVFAALHDNAFAHGIIGWIIFSGRFLMGLAASAFAIKYRSLRPSTIMHGTLNGIACISELLGNA